MNVAVIVLLKDGGRCQEPKAEVNTEDLTPHRWFWSLESSKSQIHFHSLFCITVEKEQDSPALKQFRRHFHMEILWDVSSS